MEIIQTDPSSRGIYSQRELFVASRFETGKLAPVWPGQGRLRLVTIAKLSDIVNSKQIAEYI